MKNIKPRFKTNQEALEHFQARAKEFEKKYNRSFDDLWLEAEHASSWTEDMSEIHSLKRSINMCLHLIKQEG